MTVSYEEQRIQNIRDNEKLLLSLGLSAPGKATPVRAPSKKTPTSRRKDVADQAGFTHSTDVQFAPRSRSRSISSQYGDSPPSGLRRSARSSDRKPNYTGSWSEVPDASFTPTKKRGRKQSDGEEEEEDVDDGEERLRLRNAQRLGVRTQNPRNFGHIPGVEVGRWWETRMDASTDAVHAPPVAGISGNAVQGACSVALSGGYPDDVDLGTAFTYTGCGGRDLKGTKQIPKNLRTAPQTSHQTFENPMNAALRRSAETRKPVRVIRGYKLQSRYAPLEGYRYDGLYIVEKAWMATGLTNGLLVCRYAFKRVAGQPALRVQAAETEMEKKVKT